MSQGIGSGKREMGGAAKKRDKMVGSAGQTKQNLAMTTEGSNISGESGKTSGKRRAGEGGGGRRGSYHRQSRPTENC